MALLGAFAQGDLDQDEMTNVSVHLASCADCRVEHRRVAEASDLLRWYASRADAS